jgi:hypothetical protein
MDGVLARKLRTDKFAFLIERVKSILATCDMILGPGWNLLYDRTPLNNIFS